MNPEFKTRAKILEELKKAKDEIAEQEDYISILLETESAYASREEIYIRRCDGYREKIEELKEEVVKYKSLFADEAQKRLELIEKVARMEEENESRNV